MLDLIAPVFYLGWVVVNGLVAKERGRNAGAAVILSVIATPLLVYLYLVGIPVVRSEQTAARSATAPSGQLAADGYMSCRQCGTENWAKYERCQKCGEVLW